MMPSVQPGDASLPPTKVFVPAQNRLPHRTSKPLPKNRTGIFLEGQNSPEYFKHRTVPPLARPRGFAPTDYSTNYAKSKGRRLSKTSTNGDKLLTLSSATLVSLYYYSSTPPVCLPLSPPLFLRVPNVYPKQQQVVQNIRARQDWKGGFFPQPQKRSKNRHLIGRREQKPSPYLLNGIPDYQDLTRRSARNFVAAANNGVTHLEDLRSESISTFSVVTTGESLQLEDIDDKSIAGLEEVYKKIIKEEGLTHLSTKQAKGRLTSGRNKSPLLIRSFRNPQNPHPVVQYSDVRQSRPSGKEPYASRPPVPAPYFYNSRSLPKAADHGGSRVHLSRLPGTRSSDHILAAPGAGNLTKSALGFTREHSPPQGVEGQRPPALTSHRRLTESDERITSSERCRVPSTTPATSTQDLQKAMAEEEARENAKHVIIPDFCESGSNGDQLSNGRSSGRDHEDESPPIVGVASGIILSLETDEGISKAIDLEEEEERNRRDVLEYHTVQKALEESSKITVDDCTENQVDVSRESPTKLDQLLHEHSEIVCQIHELEKLTCSDDEGDTN
ncbi:hypothetical protein HOLleu_08837 [Holothuria leucospilota]|uniref:Uncharacterized protein n=1 Tax=Holothuria leucospilota TaxID=206669 RepID=A0A9Q1HGL7_HOLLE|nr:hypothetical protein HOLleu_08837 [Holothuria leucospilota]